MNYFLKDLYLMLTYTSAVCIVQPYKELLNWIEHG